MVLVLPPPMAHNMVDLPEQEEHVVCCYLLKGKKINQNPI
jgi:hypothetical protein